MSQQQAEIKSESGDTPLHLAARAGDLDRAVFLVNNGNHDKSDKTTLHYAAANGHLEVVKFLLKNGAKKLKDNDLQPPKKVELSEVESLTLDFLLKDGQVEDFLGSLPKDEKLHAQAMQTLKNIANSSRKMPKDSNQDDRSPAHKVGFWAKPSQFPSGSAIDIADLLKIAAEDTLSNSK